MLKKLKQEGITILVSTPYMDEASLCDRIALIQSGKILSIDSPNGVIRSFSNPILAIKSMDMLKLLSNLKSFPSVEDAYPFGEYHHVVMRPGYVKEELVNYLNGRDTKDLAMETVQPNIEDCFIALMKN
jgi:ABC-type multidrug transport system ATPase subunit